MKTTTNGRRYQNILWLNISATTDRSFQTKIEKMLEMKMTSNGRPPQNIKI